MGLLGLFEAAVERLRRRLLGVSPAELRSTFEDVRRELRATRAELKAEVAALRREVQAGRPARDEACGPETPVAEA